MMIILISSSLHPRIKAHTLVCKLMMMKMMWGGKSGYVIQRQTRQMCVLCKNWKYPDLSLKAPVTFVLLTRRWISAKKTQCSQSHRLTQTFHFDRHHHHHHHNFLGVFVMVCTLTHNKPMFNVFLNMMCTQYTEQHDDDGATGAKKNYIAEVTNRLICRASAFFILLSGDSLIAIICVFLNDPN